MMGPEKFIAETLSDNRILGYLISGSDSELKFLENGMAVQELDTLPRGVPAWEADGYHMGVQAGVNAYCEEHHHRNGDVCLMYTHASTVPKDGRGEPVPERYVIIVDHWTGTRLKVLLPKVV